MKTFRIPFFSNCFGWAKQYLAIVNGEFRFHLGSANLDFATVVALNALVPNTNDPRLRAKPSDMVFQPVLYGGCRQSNKRTTYSSPIKIWMTSRQPLPLFMSYGQTWSSAWSPSVSSAMRACSKQTESAASNAAATRSRTSSRPRGPLFSTLRDTAHGVRRDTPTARYSALLGAMRSKRSTCSLRTQTLVLICRSMW